MGRPSDARKRLMAAAQDAIFARSYASVSVDDLCTEAGVSRSSFYHFFPSKQALLIAAIDGHWRRFEAILRRAFDNQLPPGERVLRFFDLIGGAHRIQKRETGHMRGCPAGNLTLEMSTQDEVVRARVEQVFRDWTGYFERLVREAQERREVPANLDAALTAQALLAYFEGVMLLAKGRNDPATIHALRGGALALMQYRGAASA